MAHDPHAAHASADDEYLNPASGSGHEHTDANVSMIIQFAVWLAASAVIVHILMWFTFAFFVDVRENKGPRRSSHWRSSRVHGCRRGRGSRRSRRTRSTTSAVGRPPLLDGYSWVDKGAGTVRIPDRRGHAADASSADCPRGPRMRPVQRRATHGARADRRERRPGVGKKKAIGQ